MRENFVDKSTMIERILWEKHCSEIDVTYCDVTRKLWDWAKELGITATFLADKINASSTDDAINWLIKEKKRYYYDGKIYNREELAKLCNCSTSAFSKRIDEGMTVEEIVNTGRYRKKAQMVTIERNEKKETHTISEWREIYSINKNAYEQRINSGWSIEKALKTPVKKRKSSDKKGKLITIHGEMHTISEWCKISGINRSTYYERKKSGMSDAEALRRPVHKYQIGGEINYGKEKTGKLTISHMGLTRTLKQWADITGIKYMVLHARLKSGKTPEEILTMPLYFHSK